MNNKTVSQSNDFPKSRHWAIVTFSRFWAEGDERSRSAPGHGYPGHHVSTASYEAFFDEADWKAAIAEYEERSLDYSAFEVLPAIVARDTRVKVIV